VVLSADYTSGKRHILEPFDRKEPYRPMKKQTDEPAATGTTTPEPQVGWPSYTMVEDRMKKIYFGFYQETYKKTQIDRKTKELIAIAASLGFKCQGCLNGHIKKAKKFGATPEEISEAIAIAMGVAAASVVDLTDIAAEHLRIKHFE
jgi:AhpD family alkylhydroperoxidase